MNFVHRAEPLAGYFMPGLTAGGSAVFDFDNDGRLDILLLHNAGPSSKATHQLFHQKADGSFEDVSAGSGLDVAGYGQGVAIGDVDNDGWPDVAITEYGATRLFLNRGNGRFADITRQAGLDNPLWGTSSCFLDFDRDNWLDLVVVNYVEYDPTKRCGAKAGGPSDFCGPSSFAGSVSKLYRNRGRMAAARPNTSRFDDVTMKSKIGLVAGPGLGVVCADFDGDRWPDIFVANDGQPNRLWTNQRDGTFKDEAVERGLAYNVMGQLQAHMGVAMGDVNGDGLFDVFVTHLTEETHTLWKQGPRGQFQDATAEAKLTVSSSRSTGFGTLLADFDNDGDLDLALVNGRVAREAKTPPAVGESFWTPYAERNMLFENDGTGRFRDISPQNGAFSGTPAVSRGLVAGDIDNDGAVDLLVTAIAGPARLYRNVIPNRGHWLLVRAFDPTLKRDAYGAEISVAVGARRFVRWVNPSYSYVSSNDARAHFGLGSAQRVDAIDVVWPDGSEESFPGQPTDRSIVLSKGTGKGMSQRRAAGATLAP